MSRALALTESYTDADPWERQPKETRQAFQAFATYRELGADRSIVKVARTLSKSASLIKRWSAQHHWQVRIDAWERLEDSKKREAHLDVLTKMSERHAGSVQLAAQALSVPVREFVTRMSRMRQGDPEAQMFEGLTNEEVFQFAAVAARLLPQLIGAERLSRGASTENIEQHVKQQADVTVKVEWHDEWRMD